MPWNSARQRHTMSFSKILNERYQVMDTFVWDCICWGTFRIAMNTCTWGCLLVMWNNNHSKSKIYSRETKRLFYRHEHHGGGTHILILPSCLELHDETCEELVEFERREYWNDYQVKFILWQIQACLPTFDYNILGQKVWAMSRIRSILTSTPFWNKVCHHSLFFSNILKTALCVKRSFILNRFRISWC